VKKIIFRYLRVSLPDGLRTIFVNTTKKDIAKNLIELNKFLNKVCIIQANQN